MELRFGGSSIIPWPDTFEKKRKLKKLHLGKIIFPRQTWSPGTSSGKRERIIFERKNRFSVTLIGQIVIAEKGFF